MKAAAVLMTILVLMAVACSKPTPTSTPTPTATPRPTPTSTSTPTPIRMGPEAFSIGTGQGGKDIYLTVGQRVEGSFTIAGADVWYKVLDPGRSTVVFKDVKSSQGQFAFVAAQTGTYRIWFTSSGILTSSVVTLNLTIYWK